MKAVVVGEGPDAPLRWDEVPDPEVRPGEVLVAAWPRAQPRRPHATRGPLPATARASPIMGLEMAGRVVGLGEGVTDWAVGERVCALLPGGGYAELAAVPAGLLMRVPERMSLEEAAAVPEVFFTAFSALFFEGRAKAGETVLVHAGASGVGTAVIQMGARAGCRVFATAGGAEKVAACERLGATLAIDRHTSDFEERIEAFLGDEIPTSHTGPGGRSGPGGIDLIIDMVGKDYFERNLRLLNVRGRIVFVAAQSGADVPLSIYALTAKRLELIGATLRARPPAEKIALRDAFLERFGPDLESGAIAPVIDQVFPVAQVEAAHARMGANRNIGKIVLRIADV